jgi:hypothetical protein
VRKVEDIAAVWMSLTLGTVLDTGKRVADLPFWIQVVIILERKVTVLAVDVEAVEDIITREV